MKSLASLKQHDFDIVITKKILNPLYEQQDRTNLEPQGVCVCVYVFVCVCVRVLGEGAKTLPFLWVYIGYGLYLPNFGRSYRFLFHMLSLLLVLMR